MVLGGEGLGDKAYEFIVEKADSEDGPWTEVAKVEASVEGEKAAARFKFPKLEPTGHITKVQWKREKAKAGDRLGMHVEAAGLEGGWIAFIVEKQENGEWVPETRWDGSIEGGKAEPMFHKPA